MRQQILFTFTVNTDAFNSEKELEEFLDENCPLEATDTRFAISTESWEVVENYEKIIQEVKP